MSELKWFFLILIIMWLFWSLTGGPERTQNIDKPFLEQPAPIEGGDIYDANELREKNPGLFPGR